NAHRGPRTRRPAGTRRGRPRLEVLEDRVVFSTSGSGFVLQTDVPLVPGRVYQSGGYSAALAPTDNFQNISGDPPATPVLDSVDDEFVEASIGFDFSFFNATYSKVWVTSNGLLTFSAVPNDTGYSDYTNTDLQTDDGPNRPLIAVLWDDWITSVSAADKVYY